MVRERNNFFLSFLAFVAALLVAASCGKNFYDGQTPIGFECSGENATSMCGGPHYDDPGQNDDAKYHQGENPDHHTTGNGSTTGGSGEMAAAPMRFGYDQLDVAMNGDPEY